MPLKPPFGVEKVQPLRFWVVRAERGSTHRGAVMASRDPAG